MSKFKVGDIIRITQAINGVDSNYVGQEQVVTSIHTGVSSMPIGTDRFYLSIDQIEFVKSSEKNPHYTTDSTGLSGGLNNYYLVDVLRPQREGQQPYTAECEDIIGALDLNFDEGNIFKAIWRAANARKGNGKAGHVPKYDAEKVYHSAGRILKRNS